MRKPKVVKLKFKFMARKHKIKQNVNYRDK